MVARNSSAVGIEICDGHGLCGFTGNRKKATPTAEFPRCPDVGSDPDAIQRRASNDSSSWFGWTTEAAFTAFATLGIRAGVNSPQSNRVSSVAAGIVAEIKSGRASPVVPPICVRQARGDNQLMVSTQTTQDNPLELCVLLTWLTTNRLQLRGGLVRVGR